MTTTLYPRTTSPGTTAYAPGDFEDDANTPLAYYEAAQYAAAYGWDTDAFAEHLGDFPTLDAALDALNTHAETRAAWGRLRLSAPATRLEVTRDDYGLSYAPPVDADTSPPVYHYDTPPPFFEVYGWSPADGRFCVWLGKRLTLEAALEALYFHAPTRERFGRFLPPEDAP